MQLSKMQIFLEELIWNEDILAQAIVDIRIISQRRGV
jgi:hypothetical protein